MSCHLEPIESLSPEHLFSIDYVPGAILGLEG